MKKYIIGFIFGLIIAGTISVSAYNLLAKDVSYTPSWTKENGESITNVKDAMDELYKKSNGNMVYGEDTSTNYSTLSPSYRYFQEVNLGFKPKMVVAIIESWSGNNGYLRAYVYSEDSTSIAFDRGATLSSDNIENVLKINDNGFKWYVMDGSWGPQHLYYYAIK